MQNHIHSIIDKAIHFAEDNLRANSAPIELLHENMIDFSKKSPSDGVYFWKAIPAEISNENFSKFESIIGAPLPESYKQFLGYKYFLELQFGHLVNFFPHKPTWMDDYYGNIWDSDFEDTIAKRIIPFAFDDNGTGYVCFDARESAEQNNFPIVTYDRTFGIDNYGMTVKTPFTFLELLEELDKTLDEWKQRRSECA